MNNKELDSTSLETILNKTINIIESSKKQIFEIAEDARFEKANVLQRLEGLNKEINKVITEVDYLEDEYRKARRRLASVSQNFKLYSEKDVQNAYDAASQLQAKLYIARENEINLKNNRSELHMRIKSIELTIERAEMLVTQISVVANYLTGDLSKVTQLMESAQIRQMFGLKIIQAQEEERKRLARDIHDGPAQSMANVVLRTEIAERLLNNQQIESAIKELKDLKGMIRQSLADVRQIIFDLRPMALDDLGLLPTLRKFLPEIAKREDLHIELNITGKEKRLPSGMEVAIFRLIQESVNNILKHAKAKIVQVNIEFSEDYIKVLAIDNGVGFEAEEVMKNKDKFGLIGMKERVQLLEGKCEIDSRKNYGTTVTFQVPIKESEERSDD